jgi:hypothetical protein
VRDAANANPSAGRHPCERRAGRLGREVNHEPVDEFEAANLPADARQDELEDLLSAIPTAEPTAG